MRSTRWLIFSALLFFCLFASPPIARADVHGTVDTILDIVHSIPMYSQDVPSSSEIHPLLTCLENQDVWQCAEYAGADSPYVDTFKALIEAVSSDNFGQIVDLVWNWLKEDAPCIIADILTGGMGGALCSVVKEIVEALVAIGEAVWNFLKDVGEAVVGAIEDIGCALGLGGCHNSPPDQIAYAWIYAPKIGDGVAAMKDPDKNKIYQVLQGLRAQASANPAQFNIPLPKSFLDMFQMTIPGWAIDTAEKAYEGVVVSYWNADITKTPDGGLWKRETVRGSYLNDQQVIQSLAGQAVTQDLPGDWIKHRCIDRFDQDPELAHIARWQDPAWFNTWERYVPPAEQQNAQQLAYKIPRNDIWCGTFVSKHGPQEFAASFREYIKANLCEGSNNKLVCPSIPNYDRCGRVLYSVSHQAQVDRECILKAPSCPQEAGKYVCPKSDYAYCYAWAASVSADYKLCSLQPPNCKEFLGKYFCETKEDYAYCGEWAASVQEQAAKRCGIDTTILAKEAAENIRGRLKAEGSKFDCRVNPGPGPLQLSATTAKATTVQTADLAAAAKKSGAAQMAQPGAVAKAEPGIVAGAQKAKVSAAAVSGGPMTAKVPESPVNMQPAVLDCPRPRLQYWCKRYNLELTGSLPVDKLVDCTLTPDPGYKMMWDQVNAALAVINSNEDFVGAFPLTGTEGDPLLVAPHPSQFAELQKAKTNYFAVPPSSKTTFDFVQSLKQTVDGVNTPTMFWDSQAAMKKQTEDKAHIGISTEAQAKKKFEALKSGDYVNPEVVSPDPRAKAQLDKQTVIDAVEKQSITTQSKTAVQTMVQATAALKTNVAKTPAEAQAAAAAQQTTPMMGPAPGAPGTAQAPGTTPSTAQPLTTTTAKTTGTAPSATGTQTKSAYDAFKPIPGALPAGAGTAPTVAGTPQSKPMSGAIPPGPAPGPTAAVSPTRAPAPTVKPGPALFPELSSTERLTVGGTSAAWGGMVRLDAAQAASINKNNSGLCEFVIEHAVRNTGTAKAGSFRTVWTNQTVTGNWNRVWGPLEAGAVKSERELIPLKPGTNLLQFVVDDLRQVQESNKADNTTRLRIDVTGNCGVAMRAPQPAPQRPAIPKPPGM